MASCESNFVKSSPPPFVLLLDPPRRERPPLSTPALRLVPYFLSTRFRLIDGNHDEDDLDEDEEVDRRDEARDDEEADEAAEVNLNRPDDREVEIIRRERRRGLFILINLPSRRFFLLKQELFRKQEGGRIDGIR